MNTTTNLVGAKFTELVVRVFTTENSQERKKFEKVLNKMQSNSVQHAEQIFTLLKDATSPNIAKIKLQLAIYTKSFYRIVYNQAIGKNVTLTHISCLFDAISSPSLRLEQKFPLVPAVEKMITLYSLQENDHMQHSKNIKAMIGKIQSLLEEGQSGNGSPELIKSAFMLTECMFVLNKTELHVTLLEQCVYQFQKLVKMWLNQLSKIMALNNNLTQDTSIITAENHQVSSVTAKLDLIGSFVRMLIRVCTKITKTPKKNTQTPQNSNQFNYGRQRRQTGVLEEAKASATEVVEEPVVIEKSEEPAKEIAKAEAIEQVPDGQQSGQKQLSKINSSQELTPAEENKVEPFISDCTVPELRPMKNLSATSAEIPKSELIQDICNFNPACQVYNKIMFELSEDALNALIQRLEPIFNASKDLFFGQKLNATFADLLQKMRVQAAKMRNLAREQIKAWIRAQQEPAKEIAQAEAIEQVPETYWVVERAKAVVEDTFEPFIPDRTVPKSCPVGNLPANAEIVKSKLIQDICNFNPACQVYNKIMFELSEDALNALMQRLEPIFMAPNDLFLDQKLMATVADLLQEMQVQAAKMRNLAREQIKAWICAQQKPDKQADQMAQSLPQELVEIESNFQE